MAHPPKELRLAVLIDADNVPYKAIKEMMEEVSNYGTPTIKRIYGDFTSTSLQGWKDALNEHAITPMQQYSYTTGKNATDSALIIDAMDMLYSGDVEGFFIVSSDSDFTKLATRLREKGKKVFGMGEKKTPMPFIKACEKFIYIEVLKPPPGSLKSTTKASTPSSAAPIQSAGADLQRLVTATIGDLADDSGWVALGGLGNGLIKRLPEFDARNYGHKRLSDLMRALPYVEVETRDMSGNKHDYVRAKP